MDQQDFHPDSLQSLHSTREFGTLTSERKRVVLASLEKGATVVGACEAAGVTRQAYYKWLQEDRDFAKVAGESIGASIASVEDALFVVAMSGNIAAIKFFLKNRSPDQWKEKPEADREAPSEKLKALSQLGAKIYEKVSIGAERPTAEEFQSPTPEKVVDSNREGDTGTHEWP